MPYYKKADYLYGLPDDNKDGKIDGQDNPANDPFVLDVRSQEKYEGGHIPGAINIPFEGLANEESLALLPTDREIIIVDRDHSLSQQLVMYLNLLGFDYHKVFNLKWGMVSWTKDSNIAPGRFTEDSRSNNNSFPADPTTPKLEDGPVYAYPQVNVSQTEVRAAVLERAKEYFPKVAKRWYLYTDELMTILDDDKDGVLYSTGDEPSNDPFILDVLPPSFAGLNIPGHRAMNWRDIPALANLQHLPPDRQIVSYCIPGGASEQMTMLLSLLGYNAINLKWSSSAWNKALHDPNFVFNDDLSYDYPIETGGNSNHPPHTPGSPSPSDGSLDQPLDPTLGWTGGDPDAGDAVTYDVYFGSVDPPPLVSSDRSETSYHPGPLLLSTHYYWGIVARDAQGEETAGPFWSFTTRAALGSTIRINGGAEYTNRTRVTLDLVFGGETTHLRFSHDGNRWSSWKKAAPTFSWNLPRGDGEKSIHVQFARSVPKSKTPSQLSETVNGTIVLDTARPTGSISIAWVPIGHGQLVYRGEAAILGPSRRASLCLYLSTAPLP